MCKFENVQMEGEGKVDRVDRVDKVDKLTG
jgi:hypothetical protein